MNNCSKFNPSTLSCIRFYLLPLLVYFLGGCAQLLFEKQHSVEPGDKEYPQQNPTPTRILNLSIINSDLIDYELRAVYSAPESSKCRYLQNALEGVYSGYSISLPVSVLKSDGAERAQLIVDKYKPGMCGWQFSTLLLSVSNDGRQAIGSTIISNPQNTLFGIKQREALLSNKRTTDNSPVILECSFTLIKQWHERGMNGQPCTVNGVRGGVGKVLMLESGDITVRIQKNSYN